MKFENRRGPKRRKKKKKKRILEVGKLIFFLVIISLLLFFCTSKMISRLGGNIPITFQITQNETHMMKI
jgi:hypothetical protein